MANTTIRNHRSSSDATTKDRSVARNPPYALNLSTCEMFLAARGSETSHLDSKIVDFWKTYTDQ